MTASKPSPRSRKDAAATAKASTDQAAAGPAQSPATTPAPPARKPSLKKANKRPEGQWAVDGQEPLNANEVVKAADDGLHVRPRIIDIYSKTGFDSIPEDDLQTRFRWWGLYTQRKPGLDGTANATMSDIERSDKYFLQRIRIDGMPLSIQRLRVLASISTDFGRDTADITDRQNLQVHWIDVADLPEIWRRLESVGLNTVHTAGDAPRAFTASPVAGVSANEIVDPTPVIAEIREKWIGTEEVSNLPRKFKTCFTGDPSLDVAHELNDISFVGVRHPELGPGFDIWAGGGLSANPHLAERLGAFVTADEAADVWHAMILVFRDYGFRRLRNKARMKFLVEAWGVEKLRDVLEREYLGHKLADGPAPEAPTEPGDHIGVHDQKNGRKYVGFAPTVGRLSGTILAKVADAAEKAGSDDVRFTPYQKLLVLDVEPDRVDQLVADMEELGLTAHPKPFRRNTMACTGIEFCKQAFTETKAPAARMVADLDTRLADVTLPGPITLNMNGCPHSCARIQVADIGLKGQLTRTPEGETQQTYQVHLGGGLVSSNRDDPGLGRTVRGLKVTPDDLTDYVERLTRRFLEQRADDESFAQWAHRAEEDSLR